MLIKTDDILDFLVARSAAPSTIGAQLERLQFGLSTTPDPFRARDELEAELLNKAQLLRCIDKFALRQDFHANYKALEKLQRFTPGHPPQGYLALAILRAYQEWASTSKERALVAVYQYLSQTAPNFTPPPPKNEPDLVQAFRENKAKRARSISAEVYADSLLALGSHLVVWNKRCES